VYELIAHITDFY